MTDIGIALVANLNILTEFSRSVEATAEWWNHVKSDLESPNPTLLPLEKGSSDAHALFSKWAEIKQEFQRYHNVVCLYFCRRVLNPEAAERAPNLHDVDVTLGERSKRALPRTPRIFRRGLNLVDTFEIGIVCYVVLVVYSKMPSENSHLD